MAGLRRGGRRSVAPIVLILLILSLACTFAVQPGVQSPDSVLQASYAGLRPDWVRLPSLGPRWTSPPVSIQLAPSTWIPLPTTAPTSPQVTPTQEAPPPTETIAIAGIAPPVVSLPPATAAPPPPSPSPAATAPLPTESPSTPSVTPSPPPTPTLSEGQDLAFAAQILQLVNETRVANGLPSLSEHPALLAAAQEYADLHAHVSPDRLNHNLNGSTLGSRIGAKNYTGWTLLAENIAWGTVDPPLSPADILQLWLGSPSHRENIMNPTLNETGVGCYVSGTEEPFRICVQDFGARP